MKTQLCYLLDHIPSHYRSDLCRKIHSLFDFTVGIYPEDEHRWVWSNLLADHTGIFVPGSDMNQAIEELKRNPIYIPISAVRTLLLRLRAHKLLMPTCDLVVRTESISTLGAIFDFDVPADREFSSVSPKAVVANAALIDDEINYCRHHL